MEHLFRLSSVLNYMKRDREQKKASMRTLMSHDLQKSLVFPIEGFLRKSFFSFRIIDGCQVFAELLPEGFLGVFKLLFHFSKF